MKPKGLAAIVAGLAFSAPIDSAKSQVFVFPSYSTTAKKQPVSINTSNPLDIDNIQIHSSNFYIVTENRTPVIETFESFSGEKITVKKEAVFIGREIYKDSILHINLNQEVPNLDYIISFSMNDKIIKNFNGRFKEKSLDFNLTDVKRDDYKPIKDSRDLYKLDISLYNMDGNELKKSAALETREVLVDLSKTFEEAKKARLKTPTLIKTSIK